MEKIMNYFSWKYNMELNRKMIAGYKVASKKKKLSVITLIVALLGGNFLLGYKCWDKPVRTQVVAVANGLIVREVLKKALIQKGE